MNPLQLCFDFYNNAKEVVINTAKRLKKTFEKLCLNFLPSSQTQSQQMSFDFNSIPELAFSDSDLLSNLMATWQKKIINH